MLWLALLNEKMKMIVSSKEQIKSHEKVFCLIRQELNLFLSEIWRLFAAQSSYIRIENVIKKGRGIRPDEALATLR